MQCKIVFVTPKRFKGTSQGHELSFSRVSDSHASPAAHDVHPSIFNVGEEKVTTMPRVPDLDEIFSNASVRQRAITSGCFARK